MPIDDRRTELDSDRAVHQRRDESAGDGGAWRRAQGAAEPRARPPPSPDDAVRGGWRCGTGIASTVGRGWHLPLPTGAPRARSARKAPPRPAARSWLIEHACCACSAITCSTRPGRDGAGTPHTSGTSCSSVHPLASNSESLSRHRKTSSGRVLQTLLTPAAVNRPSPRARAGGGRATRPRSPSRRREAHRLSLTPVRAVAGCRKSAPRRVDHRATPRPSSSSRTGTHLARSREATSAQPASRLLPLHGAHPRSSE